MISNAGLGFILAFAAGAASVVGGVICLYLPKRIITSPGFLAGCLSFAAGVMMYVSLVELLPAAQHHLILDTWEADQAEVAATGLLFLGIIISEVLHMLVHWLERVRSQWRADKSGPTLGSTTMPDALPVPGGCSSPGAAAVAPPSDCAQAHSPVPDEELAVVPTCIGSQQSTASSLPNSEVPELLASEPAPIPSHAPDLTASTLFTTLAICLHNFPEGAATLVSTLADPTLGVVIAIALVCHNIPEGVVIAIPTYASSESRRTAILWTVVAAAAEPIGAGLVWAVLMNALTDTVYGVMFAIVGGIMVHICARELLPSAARYDPAGRVLAVGTLLGMFVMAFSLVMIKI